MRVAVGETVLHFGQKDCKARGAIVRSFGLSAGISLKNAPQETWVERSSVGSDPWVEDDTETGYSSCMGYKGTQYVQC